MKELQEETTVYVLVHDQGAFVSTIDLSTRNSWTYGFTSPEKATTFLKIVRQTGFFKNIKRVFPCTLKEYFEIQKKRNLPNVALDLDPIKVRNYAAKMMVGDSSQQNVSCLTTTAADEKKIYQVAVSPRTDV